MLGHVHQEEAPAHKHSGVPLYMPDEVGRERGLGFSSNPVNGTQTQKSGRKWMDGWMERQIKKFLLHFPTLIIVNNSREGRWIFSHSKAVDMRIFPQFSEV